jgi:1,4-dihydroxy-6-naphthoate synthase
LKGRGKHRYNQLMDNLTLGYSPCPNDTFIFYALVHGKLGLKENRYDERLEDVQTLNLMAAQGTLDITKVSFAAYAALRESYVLLRSGAALGRGCGPLVVSQKKQTLNDLRGKKIAIPGVGTTAYLLLRLFDPELGRHVVPMPFDQIMPAVKNGEVQAGLIIHESRFTYPEFGLVEVEDLGRWWEEKTGTPKPLGGIIAKRSLGVARIQQAQAHIRKSIEYAHANEQQTRDYIKAHSQELSDEVIASHIALYVNDFSLDLGDEGQRAIDTLFNMARARGIIAESSSSLFID